MRGHARFFRVIRFDRSIRGSQQAIRYVAFRSEDVKGKQALIFDHRTDSADVKAFAKDLDQRVTRHHSAAKAYHTLFSLRRQDMERAVIQDFREVVRDVMKGYELETGKKLHWIASNHDNPTHPHCHVIIRGTYTDKAGRERKLFLNKREVERIKDLTGRALEARGLTPERPPERQHPPRQGARDSNPACTILAFLQKQIRAHQHQQAREQQEIERRRQREQERSDSGR